MRVFVTGATGLIGRALVRRLVERGDVVVAWVRDEPRARRSLGDAVSLRSTAVSDAELSACLSTVDGVVNLAGEPLAEGRWTPARKRALTDSRVALTHRLVRGVAGAEPRPTVLVSGSAVGIYGDRGDEVLADDAQPGDDFAARLCVDWEAAALDAEALGVRVVRVRTGVVLTAGGGALGKMLPAFRLGLGGPIGSGRQGLSWIHLDDEVALLLAALDDDRLTGPVNGAAPNPVSSREFAAALGRALGRPAVLPVPGFALRLALGEVSGVLLGGQRAVPSRLLRHGFVFRFPTIDAALANLLRTRDGAVA